MNIVAKLVDLTGKKFNMLTVIHKCDFKKNNKVTWHCRCDCGNEVDVNSRELTKGVTWCCGCTKKEHPHEDFTGKRFGSLVAIEYVGKNSWKCRCDCGGYIVTRGYGLKTGHSLSCGHCTTNNMIGKKYGHLTVLELVGSNKDGRDLVRCRCDCGNEKVCVARELRNGSVVTCGCRIGRYDNTGLVGVKNASKA